ncbi:MAG TPA: hypothetical protein VL326_37135 [Kofleriaceae bacterium]|nr:hypothetical protein [Kofleriaceae bacterium]
MVRRLVTLILASSLLSGCASTPPRDTLLAGGIIAASGVCISMNEADQFDVLPGIVAATLVIVGGGLMIAALSEPDP